MQNRNISVMLALCLITPFALAGASATGTGADANASAEAEATVDEAGRVSATLWAEAAASIHGFANASANASARMEAELEDVTASLPDADSLTAWSTTRILTPLQGAELSETVTIRGTASAAKGYRVHHVAIRVDGQYMGIAEGTEDWTFQLDTRTLVDGNHTFRATSMAAPAALPYSMLVGWKGDAATFTTANDLPGILLLDVNMDLEGAHGVEPWVFPVEQNYTGLRITLEITPANETAAPLAGELVVAYAEGTDAESGANPEGPEWPSHGPVRGWVRTHGVINGGAEIVRPPHGVMAAPGVLTLSGAFGGMGHVHLRVEALPAS